MIPQTNQSETQQDLHDRFFPFEKMKELIAGLNQQDIAEYEGALCTQQTSSNGTVSVIEVKVVIHGNPATES